MLTNKKHKIKILFAFIAILIPLTAGLAEQAQVEDLPDTLAIAVVAAAPEAGVADIGVLADGLLAEPDTVTEIESDKVSLVRLYKEKGFTQKDISYFEQYLLNFIKKGLDNRIIKNAQDPVEPRIATIAGNRLQTEIIPRSIVIDYDGEKVSIPYREGCEMLAHDDVNFYYLVRVSSDEGGDFNLVVRSVKEVLTTLVLHLSEQRDQRILRVLNDLTSGLDIVKTAEDPEEPEIHDHSDLNDYYPPTKYVPLQGNLSINTSLNNNFVIPYIDGEKMLFYDKHNIYYLERFEDPANCFWIERRGNIAVRVNVDPRSFKLICQEINLLFTKEEHDEITKEIEFVIFLHCKKFEDMFANSCLEVLEKIKNICLSDERGIHFFYPDLLVRIKSFSASFKRTDAYQRYMNELVIPHFFDHKLNFIPSLFEGTIPYRQRFFGVFSQDLLNKINKCFQEDATSREELLRRRQIEHGHQNQGQPMAFVLRDFALEAALEKVIREEFGV